jgi:opine dehydrogenase
MTAIEKERLTIMQALNLQPIRITDIPLLARGKPMSKKEQKTLEERRKSWRKRVGMKGLERRYLAEDIPYGLVTIASLARMVGVQTPTIEAEITLASLIHQTNYWRRGRTTKSLGIDGLSVNELNTFVNEGIYPR